MANKRAGLPEAPTAVVQPPNLGSGGAHPATIQAYEDLARAAKSIGDMVQPAIDANTERDARAAVARGDFRHTMGLTRQDQIADKIVDAGFMAQASMDVDRTIGELENKHLATLNMEEFAKDNEAARTLYLQNTDPRYAPQLGLAWDQQALNATQRLSSIATQKAIKLADEKMSSRLKQLEDELSGSSNPFDPEVMRRLNEINAIQDARVAKGDISHEEKAAGTAVVMGRMTANRVSDAAVAHYADGNFSDQAYAESLKMIDDAMASPKLGLGRSERDHYFSAAKTALNAQRSEVQRQERELAARLREAQSEALSQFSIDFADARGRAAEGAPISTEELQDLYKQAARTRNPQKYIAQVDRLAVTGSIQQTFRSMSIPEQEASLNRIEQAAAAGDVEAGRQLGPARNTFAASKRAAEADPATYQALREGRDVPKVDWSTGDSIIDTMTGRFHEADIASANLGVAPRYFSPSDRAQLRAIADKGGVDALKAVTAIVRSADAAGVDPLKVMEEVGGSGAPLMATAGALLAQGASPNVASMILSGKDAMGSELVKDKMPKQATQASAQRAVLGDRLSSMSPAAVDALTRSADAYFATDLLNNKGEAVGGEAEAYKRAMRAVTGEWQDDLGKVWGGQAKVRDRATRVPPWIRQSDFPSLVSGLTREEILRSSIGSEAKAGAGSEFFSTLGKYYGRDATVADYRSAKLIEAGSGRYYVAPDPSQESRLILNSRGEPMVLDLNVIREDLKQRSTGVR